MSLNKKMSFFPFTFYFHSYRTIKKKKIIFLSTIFSPTFIPSTFPPPKYRIIFKWIILCDFEKGVSPSTT